MTVLCGYRKPNARGISYITDYFGVENSNLLLVGDEEKDHRTAINAGCDYM
ncbi:MAG: HAD hydrolase-like protein, partial [Lachnospiraceae bacterium]|nr:HAD hydrolase-like protein [Lachnospiraceae bacterium]